MTQRVKNKKTIKVEFKDKQFWCVSSCFTSLQDKENITRIISMLFASAELDDVEHQCVSPEIIAMALHVCQEFLSVLKHGDIDVTAETPHLVKEQQWAGFLQDYYMVVQ